MLSAVFYASYTIAIRVMLKDDESASMMLFFGFVGALNLVCLAPVLGMLWAASVVDPRQLSAKMFGLTVGKGDSPLHCMAPRPCGPMIQPNEIAAHHMCAMMPSVIRKLLCHHRVCPQPAREMPTVVSF